MPLAVPLARRTRALAEPAGAPADGASTVAEAARQAASDALDRGETHYTDRPGIGALRAAVAGRVAERTGADLDPSDAVVTCGATEARFVAVQRLAGPDTPVVALGHAERLTGACTIRGVDLVGPADAPTGAAVLYVPEDASGADLDAALTQANERGWAVVAEVDLTAAGAPFRPADHGLAERTVHVGDVTGPFGAAAWRVGFLTAPSVQVGPLRDFKQALTICTTAVSQWGALALLEETA